MDMLWATKTGYRIYGHNHRNINLTNQFLTKMKEDMTNLLKLLFTFTIYFSLFRAAQKMRKTTSMKQKIF